MNALAELQKRALKPAIFAIPAIPNSRIAGIAGIAGGEAENYVFASAASLVPAPFADSLKQLRGRLLALAASEWIDAAPVHRLHDLDVTACIGLDTGQLVAYLSMLSDTAERHAGRVPRSDTAPMQCEQCGPVWIHPSVAEVLPMVAGWPRALGCAWCFVRKAGRYIPRPPVACGECAHFTQNTINPDAGMGDCGAGKGAQYPLARQPCATYSPSHLMPRKGDLA